MTDIHDTADLVIKALRRAWQLGQDYWQHSDSEYRTDWRKADATRYAFDQLVVDTKAALTSNSGAQPTPSVPAGWKLVPIEPTSEMLRALIDGANQYDSWNEGYRDMLAAAPEAKPCP